MVRSVQELIDAADTAGLLLAVDRLVAAGNWDALLDLGRRCTEAVELGHQLWPVAMHVDYRIALRAPGRHAGGVCRPGAARFAPGPLTEVAASRHSWGELAAFVDHPASRLAVVQERAIRGEDLREATTGMAHELPAVLMPFEPSYALPAYDDHGATFPEPPVATRVLPSSRVLAGHGTLAPDEAAAALRAVVEAWVTQSRGRARVAVVTGSAEHAVAALAPEAATERIDPSEALALLQWAGASGGAHGRRRGGAAGRFAAWWAAAGLAGLDWPDVVDEAFAADLGTALGELEWFRWAPPAPRPGWSLRVAVGDPFDDLAWAIDAADERAPQGRM